MAVMVGAPITSTGSGGDDAGNGYFEFTPPPELLGLTITSATLRFWFDWDVILGYTNPAEWRVSVICPGVTLRSWEPPASTYEPLTFSTPEVITCIWQSTWDPAPTPITSDPITVYWTVPASAGVAPIGYPSSVEVEITFYEDVPTPPTVGDLAGGIDNITRLWNRPW